MKTTSDIRDEKLKKNIKIKNMEISESLLEDLKEIPGYQSTISIDTTLDKDIYRVNYIEVSFIGKNAPFFIFQ
jgi:hypothetical protein